eukprot:NODE_228_length_12276_cov_0.305337.p6 type:complete len:105 gc:universal NODE_228_length_12276_cov_0.305337:920-1234(+)
MSLSVHEKDHHMKFVSNVRLNDIFKIKGGMLFLSSSSKCCKDLIMTLFLTCRILSTASSPISGSIFMAEGLATFIRSRSFLDKTSFLAQIMEVINFLNLGPSTK